MPSEPATKVRVLVLAVGGATCSGKTLLAKHIRRVLPNCMILHQDDFAPAQELIPLKNGVQDWDTPSTAIDWPLFRRALTYAKEHAALLPEVHGHDHLNKQNEVEIDSEMRERWKERFDALVKEEKADGVEWKFVIVDGFLLYYDPECVAQYDVRLFLRVPHDILKARREERAQYVTQNPLLATAGDVWSDPPNYFSEIVYPAYVEAHQHMFTNGDVEKGALLPQWSSGDVGDAETPEVEVEVEGKGKGKEEVVKKTPLEVFEPAEGTEGMEMMVNRSLGLVFDAVKTI